MRVPEARIGQAEHGAVVESDGWFVLNTADAVWDRHHIGGRWVAFDGNAPFEQLGIGIHVLEPGEPNGKYHSENQQEDFLVLSGECILLVEGEERRLAAWDFVHCPPGAHHIFVGAGDGPCAILMVGARVENKSLHYPGRRDRLPRVDPRRDYGSAQAYSDWERPPEPVRADWPPST